MIDYTNTLNALLGKIDIDATGATDASELVAAAERVVKSGATAVLVSPAAVHTIWAWLENKGVSIFARQKVDEQKTRRGADADSFYMKLVAELNSTLKKGADGIVLQADGDAAGLMSVLFSVRADLFFGKKLILAVDLGKTDALSWGALFLNLKKCDADGLFLTAGAAAEPDVAGRLFGMLNAWDAGFDGMLYFDLGRPGDVEGAFRLIGKMRPELKNRVRFFIKNRA